VQTQAHTFRSADLVGGHVVLDLANTVTGRDGDPIDWLDCYEALLEWAALTEAFDPPALAELAKLNAAAPQTGARALRRLRALRETAHNALVETIRAEPLPPETLAGLGAFWRAAAATAGVTMRDGRGRLELAVPSSGLNYLNHALALRAVDLFQTLPLSRTRICAGRNCGWLFIDTSKGGRRRWCDMATCGNAAKGRRHYQRKRAAREKS
jgi:predicted RNA-binding Zn ribbon-like protein